MSMSPRNPYHGGGSVEMGNESSEHNSRLTREDGDNNDDNSDDDDDDDDHPAHEGLTLLNSQDKTCRYIRSYCRGYCSCFFQRMFWIVLLLLVIVLLVALLFIQQQQQQQQKSDLFLKDQQGQTCGFEPDPIMKLKESSTVDSMQHGAVASDHPVCSQIGVDILQQLSGNAIDAAVATTLCLGVANPASSGIGGGTFMMVHVDRNHHETRWNTLEHPPDFIDARNNDNDITSSTTTKMMTEVIDAREVAPGAAYTEMFMDKNASSVNGGLSVAVLGELRGLELAHARHGLLDWEAVVEPAMRLARDGVKVSPHLAGDIAGSQRFIKAFHLTTIQTFLSRPDGSMLQEGDILRNPALADTLEAIMRDGADAVYKGQIAKTIAEDVQKAGGILTEQDINKFQATLRSPLVAEASGFTIVGVPPPSSGGAAILGILRFLASFETPLASFGDSLSIHRMVEAMKHAFAMRMSLSDPNYFTDTVRNVTRDLISGNYMASLRSLYRDNETARLSAFGGPKWAQLKDNDGQSPAGDAHEGDRRRKLRRQLYREFGYLDDHGTTHLSVVDSKGNAVVLTSTVNTYFGSGVMSESTGIILNDQMDDFGSPGKANFYGLIPSEANFIKPGKKPLSSMSPTLVFRKNDDKHSLGDLFMALGASGGPKIITAVVQVFINHAHLGMPLFEAMAHPRVHDQLLYHNTDVTCLEQDPLDQGPTIRITNRTKSALLSRGHQVINVDYTGTVQAIAVDLETNTMTAVSDIRKGGMPGGY